MSDRFDLVIIGSGPGGYVAAIRAAQLGQKVAIVERERLGGICLNWGCIPTKALLRSAEIKHYLDHAASYGLSAEGVGFDLVAVTQRSRRVAAQLNAGVAHLMKKNRVTVVEGEAALAGPTSVKVGERRLEAANVIVATGARARELPHLKADGVRIWTYRHAMVPPAMPTRLLVIGSGAIGIEFASFYADLGAQVTVVEMMDRILPVEDEEISAFMAKAFGKRGLRLLTSASVEALVADAEGVTATIGGRAERFSHAIIAIGIVPNTEGLGLEALGVAMDRGHIATDSFGRTSVAGLWAIGDVTGPPWLAHKASHEGVVAAEAIAGHAHAHPMDRSNIPGCTYSRPQVASVGLTEAQAREAGYAVRVGRFQAIGNGKAIALGEPEGLVKTVFDAETGALLGAHMAGAEVTELIQGFAIARQCEATHETLAATIFPHPTLSEMMHEAVLDAEGRVLHL
ncbi:dihydrolipoyl dehydrogenase [Thermaurantiacus tibetensis]|uniref:dihydrolipoyl dehydrogenase n=1 Tax=Thermaurantiacus tibetensis TaxID=2759035 RepID=UPI00188EE4DC|nr:dihydrolipoyl dehydrogenase [Thermaurantiacus tibetensis]